MARMGLDEGVDYMFDSDWVYLYIRLSEAYRQYTKYMKDELPYKLSYRQFLSELKKYDFVVGSRRRKWPDRKYRQVWIIDFEKMSDQCKVMGFMHDSDAVYEEVDQ